MCTELDLFYPVFFCCALFDTKDPDLFDRFRVLVILNEIPFFLCKAHSLPAVNELRIGTHCSIIMLK